MKRPLSEARDKKPAPDRGGAAEENLRAYFLDAGYFVIRGGKITYQQNDVTDVDLWLYAKPTHISRERACVDAKYKEKPKALERILWAKGLQSVLGLDRCIVATTDKREVVRAFGERHGVAVLDGYLFAEIQLRKPAATRLSQEELLATWSDQSVGKLGGDWRGKVEGGSSRVVAALDFDTANDLLHRIGFFAEKLIVSRSVASCRAVYLLASYLLVTLDYRLSQLALQPPPIRRTVVIEGLRFGQQGAAHTRQVFDMATSMVESYAPGVRGRIQAEARRQYDAIPADALADFLLKQSVQAQLFDLARNFEALAFAPSLTRPASLDTAHQSILSAVLDFLRIGRNAFFDAMQLDAPRAPAPPQVPAQPGAQVSTGELPLSTNPEGEGTAS